MSGHKRIVMSLAGISAMLIPQMANAQELAYHLPKGSAGAGFQAKLITCPDPTYSGIEDLDFIQRSAVISGKVSKGELVRLNPRSPFLGSRSIALTYHPKGMLKTINAEGEAKGGAILTSLLKTAAGAVSLSGIGINTAYDGNTLSCKTNIAKKVGRLLQLKVRIAQAEGKIAAGDDLTGPALALYERNQKEAASLEKQLTLSTSAKFTVKREQLEKHFATGAKQFDTHYFVKPIDYSKWFNWPDKLPPRTGQYGFCVKAAVSRAAFKNSEPLPSRSRNRWIDRYTSSGSLAPGKLQNRFIYYRPVPVQFEVYAANKQAITDAGDKKNAQCKALIAESKKPKLSLLKKGGVSVPQLSGYFTLPLGSGAFESKATSAEFAKDGTLLAIGTKSLGAGSSIAEGLAGALTAAETLRDRRKNAIQREIDLLKVEGELELLLNPEEENAEVTQEGV